MLASGVADQAMIDKSETFGKNFSSHYGDLDALEREGMLRGEPGHQQLLLSLVGVDQVLRLVTRLLDEREFLSPHGLRALSAIHRDNPYVLHANSINSTIDYEPAESTTAMFGGNSNWRGPVWFPLHYLVCSALERYGSFFGDDVRIDFPTGSDRKLSLTEVAEELRHRSISLFLRDANGHRPCFGPYEKLQSDPRWNDNLVFNEYFHGDTGAGLGASHQTGWTGLVADQIRRRHDPDVLKLTDVVHRTPGQ